MPAPTYRITTLGCRVNLAEAREVESVLLDRGLRRAARHEAPDLQIVHTCSVTQSAVRKSRAAIRRASRSGMMGQPHVIVTGCYASTDADEASNLVGERNTLRHEDTSGRAIIDRLADRVDAWIRYRHHGSAIRIPNGAGSAKGPRREGRQRVLPLPLTQPRPGAGRHIRAEVKVQDGCDAHCTFCIIPRIRRTLRSKGVADAVAEVTRLVDLGHPEVVLTGIFLGAYGHETALRRKQDAAGAEHLADLLDAVAHVPGLKRVRLSSMEPGDITEPLIDAMIANRPVVVPHLHLPLQSGSDAILRRMNRQYRVGAYRDMLAMVNDELTREDGLPPAITTDIICGFPGETDDDFEQTVGMAREAGYLHMHVFPFSPRQGTAAARWKGQFIDETTKKSRVRRLIDMENDPRDGLSIAFRRRLLDREVRIIAEQPDRREPGLMTGRCDHYALVHVPTDAPRGTMLSVTVTDVTADRTCGQPIEAPVSLPVLS